MLHNGRILLAQRFCRSQKNFLYEAIEKGYKATIRAADSSIRIWDDATKRFASYEMKNGRLTPHTFLEAGSANYWSNQMRSYAGQIEYNLKKLIE